MNKIFLSQLREIKKDSIRFKKEIKDSKKNFIKKNDNFSIETENLFFDFSRNIIDDKSLNNLVKLAEIVDIKSNFKKLCSGELVNISEKRKVLHPAMRDTNFSLDQDITDEIVMHKMMLKKISEDINSGRKTSFSNKKFTDVVSIGTGGSYFGIKMLYAALKNYAINDINLHFISNLDSSECKDTLQELNPETTLFILVSKSFSTVETLENAKKVKIWFNKKHSGKNIMENFLAVTENQSAAIKFGIAESNIIKLWDWIGGRYSIYTGVSIGLIIVIGYKNFSKFLKGANTGDKHFLNSKLKNNIPVIMALLSFYYTRFFNAQSHHISPYNYRLRFLKEHLQQLEMESNGKSIDQNGKKFSHVSGNIVWGATGSCSQHSFYQLLHQGNTFIPSDFIISSKSDSGNQDNHDKLFSNYLSHIEILNKGFSGEESEKLYEEKFSNLGLDKKLVIKNLNLSGRKPTNALLLKSMSPEVIGELLSYYEHKTYVLGQLSNINSFDQWAVEIGKIKANDIYKDIKAIKKDKKKTNNMLLNKYLN